jgi:hypothetical protein
VTLAHIGGIGMMLEVLKPFLYHDHLYQTGDVVIIRKGNEDIRWMAAAECNGYARRMDIKEAHNKIVQYCRERGAKSKREVLEAVKLLFGLGEIHPEGGINPPANLSINGEGRKEGRKRGRRGRKLCNQGI